MTSNQDDWSHLYDNNLFVEDCSLDDSQRLVPSLLSPSSRSPSFERSHSDVFETWGSAPHATTVAGTTKDTSDPVLSSVETNEHMENQIHGQRMITPSLSLSPNAPGTGSSRPTRTHADIPYPRGNSDGRKRSKRKLDLLKAQDSSDSSSGEHRRQDEEIRKKKNRVAASKCRSKKKVWQDKLVTRVAVLEKENEKLKEMVKRQQNESLELRNMLLMHSGCGNARITNWIANSAANLRNGGLFAMHQSPVVALARAPALQSTGGMAPCPQQSLPQQSFQPQSFSPQSFSPQSFSPQSFSPQSFRPQSFSRRSSREGQDSAISAHSPNGFHDSSAVCPTTRPVMPSHPDSRIQLASFEDFGDSLHGGGEPMVHTRSSSVNIFAETANHRRGMSATPAENLFRESPSMMIEGPEPQLLSRDSPFPDTQGAFDADEHNSVLGY